VSMLGCIVCIGHAQMDRTFRSHSDEMRLLKNVEGGEVRVP